MGLLLFLLVWVVSFLYHASLSFIGQVFDVMSMYLLSTFIILYNLSRRFIIKPLTFTLTYIIANVILGYIIVKIPESRRLIFAISLLVGLLLEIWLRLRKESKAQTSLLILSVVAFATAYIVWIIDRYKIWCDPESWLQGHAMWHLMSAIAAGLVYLYYRSERPLFKEGL